MGSNITDTEAPPTAAAEVSLPAPVVVVDSTTVAGSSGLLKI